MRRGIEQLLTTGENRNADSSPRDLGVCTWATLPIKARIYDKITVVDTLNGVSGKYPAFFRPDNDGTNPWWFESDAIAAASVAALIFQSTAGVAVGGVESCGTFTIPIAGQWNIDVYGTAYSTTNLVVQMAALLGTASQASDIATLNSNSSAPCALASPGNSYTFTTGEVIYLSAKNIGANFMVANQISVHLRPRKVIGLI